MRHNGNCTANMCETLQLAVKLIRHNVHLEQPDHLKISVTVCRPQSLRFDRNCRILDGLVLSLHR